MRIITVVSNELGMCWQVNAYLENLKELGKEEYTEVLIYYDTRPIPQWDILKTLYPKAKFFFYKGDRFTNNVIGIYLPILRPYCLKKHFEAFPELQKETIVYTDTDILWMKFPHIENYSNGCYVSSTVFPNDYQSHNYLLSKRKDVDESKLASYDKINVVQKLAETVGITEQDVIDNYENCGGVQYILNNIDSQFWEKVMIDCLSIRVELQNINQCYMKGVNPVERETNGFQSWCADLWSVLYNLLYFKHPVTAIEELAFSWATDDVAKLEQKPVFHNAGVTSDETIRTNVKDENGKWIMVDAPVFFKGKYLLSTPFQDIPSLQRIINNPISNNYCSTHYTKHLLNLQNKYSLNY